MDGATVQLTRKEFDLLALLAQRPGVVFRREQIISEVWRTSWEGTGRTLEVHVASLRSKLRMPGLIETVRGVGYRLVAPAAVAAVPAVRTRLLPLLIVLMAGVLLALGFPLAVSVAAAQQQRVVVDRIDDTARFAALAQFVTDATRVRRRRRRRRAPATPCRRELARYHERVRHPGRRLLPRRTRHGRGPGDWHLPGRRARCATPSRRRCSAAAATTRRRCGPGSTAGSSSPRRSSGTATWSPSSSPTRPPAQLRSRILHGWLLIGAGEVAAMLLAVGAALRLTGWVLRPVRDPGRAPPTTSRPGG